MPTYYIGDPGRKDAARDPLPTRRDSRLGRADRYLASPGLAAAANVAISLGQPLLLTGEPGCGKTQFGEAMAEELGLQLYRFNTKSNSVARDLLYHYDAIAHFRQQQAGGRGSGGEVGEGTGQDAGALPYIRLSGLGSAIIDSNPRSPFDTARSPQRSLLLIDEVDKAPRDFPNDLLHELDRLSFSIQELGGAEFEADAALAPVVIITSNSEKHLPDAFLRRCSYFHIDFPDREALERITLMHLKDLEGRALLGSAVSFFEEAREHGLSKNPGIAELLQFLLALQIEGADLDSDLRSQQDVVRRALGVMFKSPGDLRAGTELLGT